MHAENSVLMCGVAHACWHHILQSVNCTLITCVVRAFRSVSVHDPIVRNSRPLIGIWERGKVIVMRSVIGVYSLNNAARPLIPTKRKESLLAESRLPAAYPEIPIHREDIYAF